MKVTARIERLHEIGMRARIRVVAWDLFDVREAILDAVRENAIGYPILYDPSREAVESYSNGYGARATPSFCIIDENGIVIESWIHDFDRFEAAVERLAGVELG